MPTQPGEVISSELINDIIRRLEDLEQGQGGPDPGPGDIILNQFEPLIEQAVGAVMAAVGANLPFPPDGNSVRVGDVPVPEENLRIATSNRARLEFVVPDIGAVPDGGVPVFITVRSGRQSAQRLYRILPAAGGPPIPTITRVEQVGWPPGTPPETPIIVGSEIIISGSDFAADEADNTITFTPLIDGMELDAYPRDVPLNIVSTDPTAIRLFLPDIEEITAAGGAERLRLRLAVAGAPDPGVFEFFGLRF